MQFADTGVIVLAAGLSRRYGTASKLHAELEGKPLARHIADTLSALPFQSRLAVCRFGDEELARMFADLGFMVAINPDTARGLSSSLSVGVETLAAQPVDAALICLADMPYVSAGHLQALVGRLDGDQAMVGSRAPSGAIMPPAAFARARFDELLSLEGDRGAGRLLAGAVAVDAGAEELADFDTALDFVRD